MVEVRGVEGARRKLMAARSIWNRPATVADAGPAFEDPFGVSVDVVSLADLFSGDYRFRLTCYQRAYGWREENAVLLLQAMLNRMREAGPRRSRLLLGRLVLAQPDGTAETEVVDGHQRLLTLTIIFAVLRDLETDPGRKAWLDGFIAGSAHHPRGTPVWRLKAQSSIAQFFERHVQQLDATAIDDDFDSAYLSESEANILDNRNRLISELTASHMTDELLRELQDFIAAQCHVIINVFPNEKDAWDYIKTEQDTRLPFTPADEAKAVLLGVIPAEERVGCSRLWEDCEALLIPDDMHRLLGHIRAMEWRGRASAASSAEAEICQHFSLHQSGFGFMEEVLAPSATLLAAMRRGSIGDEIPGRSPSLKSLEYLSWIDLHSWVPAALQWLRSRGERHPEMADFFKRLEALTWTSKIAGMDPGVFDRRILGVVEDVRDGKPVAKMTKLAIDDERLDTALTNLRSSGYGNKRHQAGLVLRRLSIAMGRDCGPVGREGNSVATIEHILPQRPDGKSDWRRNFRTDEDIKKYAQRLGNLALLSGVDNNQKAGSKGWTLKRTILTESRFVLSQEAALVEDWTIRAIADRTEAMIALLMQQWDIEV